jgi:BRCT domain type II-containing protein
LAGLEAGEGKIAKAKEKDVGVIDEDGLFDLIRTRPEGKEDPKVLHSNKMNEDKEK